MGEGMQEDYGEAHATLEAQAPPCLIYGEDGFWNLEFLGVQAVKGIGCFLAVGHSAV